MEETLSDIKVSLKNISYLFNQNVVRLVISLLVGAAVARYLGVEDYGRYNFVLSFLFLYKPLISFGLDELLLAKINKTENINELFGTSFVFRTITFLLFFLISIPALSLLSIDSKTYYLSILFIISMISVPFSNCELYLNAKLEIKKQASLKSILFILLALLKIVFIFFKFDLLFFVLISIFEIIGMCVISLILFQKKFHQFSILKWSFNRKLLKTLFVESFPLMLSLLVFRSMSKIDQIFIANFKTMSDLGLYGAAAKLLDAWQFLPAIISTIYLPKISQDKKFIREYFGILSLSSLGLVFGCYILGDYIIKIFYGPQFEGAGEFLKLYSVQFYFLFFALARVNVMLNDEKTSLNLSLSSVILLLNLIFNYYLIISIGSLGVIWASIISNFIGLIIFTIFNKSIREILFSYLKSTFFLFSR